MVLRIILTGWLLVSGGILTRQAHQRLDTHTRHAITAGLPIGLAMFAGTMALLHTFEMGVGGLAIMITLLLIVTRGHIERFMDVDFRRLNLSPAEKAREQTQVHRIQVAWMVLVCIAFLIAWALADVLGYSDVLR